MIRALHSHLSLAVCINSRASIRAMTSGGDPPTWVATGLSTGISAPIIKGAPSTGGPFFVSTRLRRKPQVTTRLLGRIFPFCGCLNFHMDQVEAGFQKGLISPAAVLIGQTMN